ncbi:MAG TPA: response regulator [Planctomycetota bacterium]|nr:response regulator [Planctomycetota bacterium]
MIPVEILLVEDNPIDVLFTKEAFAFCKVANNLHVVVDGAEAMSFLRRDGKFAGAVKPDIILLDLNLPKKDGREVLAEIKRDPELEAIPVVVLTSSESDQDVLRSYQLHCNCFVTKPIDMEQFVKVVRCIEDFWFTIVRLPPRKQEAPKP